LSTERYLPLARPVVGVSGKTGTWRVERPVINYSKCIKCGLCWLYCPDNVIEIVEGSAEYVKIDYDYCKGCGICSNVCPTKAISMVPEG